MKAVWKDGRTILKNVKRNLIQCYIRGHGRFFPAVVRIGACLAELVLLVGRSVVPSHRLTINPRDLSDSLHGCRLLQDQIPVIEDSGLGATPTHFAEIVQMVACHPSYPLESSKKQTSSWPWCMTGDSSQSRTSQSR